ncbi:MAG: ATP-dependent DNA helicase DinG [Pseudomonadales bacterium]|jgi:ATP-dependent DNA helicase DinG
MSAPAPSPAGLSDTIKAEIQNAYRAWLAARDFRPRRGQREMIAGIARTLTADEDRIGIIEAGTGTGKTAAYCLAAIPISRALGKTLVVSTATVALQEQVVLRDLPDLKARSGLEFNFALAKGRGRYVCLKRLDDRLRYGGQSEPGLFEAFGETGPGEDRTDLYQTLLQAFSERRWDGELDSWPESIPREAWSPITTDHRGCSNSRCSYFKQCPFFRARNTLEGTDVIVANHDLVLADLSLGGGAVLPDPQDCIYVVDEAHHLPGKTQAHFSASARLKGTRMWLDNVQNVLGTMTQRFGRPDALVDIATRIADFAGRAGEALTALEDAAQALTYEARDESLATCRFAVGHVPESLLGIASGLETPMASLADELIRAHDLLTQVQEGKVDWERSFEAEDWLVALGALTSRAQSMLKLIDAYAREDRPGEARARWANRYAEDVELVATPIEPGNLLDQAFWSRCFGAILTSATLTAVGRFDRFLERAGLAGRSAVRIPSPFDFPNIARFVVPPLAADPSDFEAHTDEVAAIIPELIGNDPGSLVLFTSWRQMLAVLDRLDAGMRPRLKVQGEGSKQALIAAHEADVQAGRQSVLFGLASFAEGVDLPDDLCRHVVIVKLPFSVPDDPLDQSMAEWAEAQGKNPFYELSVPDAALKLVQACGRLIRHEHDWGRITLLDRRIVSRRYGRDLLASLPPFRLELARQEAGAR